MSLVERIDLALLVRADAFVAWNRDRGRADQWSLARACHDMAIALVLAAALVDASTSRTTSPLEMTGYAVIGALFLYVRRRERRIMDELSRARDGAMRARVEDADWRHTNILVVAGLALLGVISFAPADVPFIAAVVTMDASFYLKAAVPPPPAPRTDLATAS